MTHSPMSSNHTPPGSVGQPHVSGAGQLVSIAEHSPLRTLCNEADVIRLSAFFISEITKWSTKDFRAVQVFQNRV